MTITQIAHFNSIKVRLKQQGDQGSSQSHQFQFHKGTIKTGCPHLRMLHPHISIP